MLKIGYRSYQLVRSQSGLHVTLNPLESGMWQQVWRFDAHFVPSDDDVGAEHHWAWEYWQMTINPMTQFRVKDWRDLARGSFLEGEGADDFIFFPDMENLLERSSKDAVRSLRLSDFSLLRREGYLFTCECDGEIEATDELPEEEFRMMMEIPFATVSVVVPLNAGDPLATAKAIAARELEVREVARSSVHLYDPNVRSWKQENRVTLELPWRLADG